MYNTVRVRGGDVTLPPEEMDRGKKVLWVKLTLFSCCGFPAGAEVGY